MRTEPRVSVPRAASQMPAATAAAEPALEPPGVNPARRGLWQRPNHALSPRAPNAASSISVLPTIV